MATVDPNVPGVGGVPDPAKTSPVAAPKPSVGPTTPYPTSTGGDKPRGGTLGALQKENPDVAKQMVKLMAERMVEDWRKDEERRKRDKKAREARG